MDYFDELTDKAKEGVESPLKAFIELKKEIDRLTKLQDQVKMGAIQEAANEPESFDRFGANVKYVSSAGSRWDFSLIQEWNDKKSELSAIEDKHKAAYQAWKRGGVYIDSETGEQLSPAGFKDGNPTIQIRINTRNS